MLLYAGFQVTDYSFSRFGVMMNKRRVWLINLTFLLFVICFLVLKLGGISCPLCGLIRGGHNTSAKALIFLGADVNLPCSKTAETPLCCALDSPVVDISILEACVNAGALKTIDRNPLFCIDHVSNADLYTDFLIKHGVDVNATGPDGYTALMKFSYSNYLSVVEKLLDHGAQIDVVSKTGCTALSEAVLQGNVEVARCLIFAGANRKMKINGKSLYDIADEKQSYYEENENLYMPQVRRD
jgi:hypothetical protein